MQDIRSIYAALLSPYNSEGKLDLQVLSRLIQFELDKGAEGFYCCGSSGEGLLLEKEERKKLVEVVAAETVGKVPFIVHTGSLSTDVTLELSLHAQSLGAKAVSMIPPIYYNYSQKEIAEYYSSVASALDIGIIIYNIPQFTGISFNKKQNVDLLENKKTIGIKHTSMNLYDLERIHDAYPEKILFNGFDEIFLYSLLAGAESTIGTMVNICPRIFKSIRKAVAEEHITEAKALQKKLNTFIEAMINTSVFPATKYAMGILGVECGPCRKPFAELDEEQKKIIRKALEGISEFL
jgi:N-acetylneuraminate lyase